MRIVILIFFISIQLAFSQSSVLIEPNATNGILSKNNSAVTLPTAQPMALPDSGAGTRLMWIPNQSVFRVGTVTADEWDTEKVGRWSFATGYDNEARGYYTASFGRGNIAQNQYTTVVGKYNQPISHPVNTSYWWYHHLFAVGNGTGYHNRNNAFTVTYDGSIGINTAKPYYRLTFKSELGDKISFWGGDDTDYEQNHYGIGIQNYLYQFFTPTIDDDIVFGTGRSRNFSENVRIKGNGKVGIGLNNPNHILDINGRARIRHITGETSGVWMSNSINSLSNADGAFFGMRDDASAGIWIGNDWRFWVDNAGRTNADGGLKVGDGTPINKIVKVSYNTDLPLLGPNEIITVLYSHADVGNGDVIMTTLSSPLNFINIQQIISLNGQMKVVFKNELNSNLDPDSVTINFVIFK